MARKQYNRIKLVLKKQGRTGKWLAQKLGKDEVTVSRWSRNVQQPHLETLYEIAGLLNVHVCHLLAEDLPEKEEKD